MKEEKEQKAHMKILFGELQGKLKGYLSLILLFTCV